jgi:hypothetical protein
LKECGEKGEKNITCVYVEHIEPHIERLREIEKKEES